MEQFHLKFNGDKLVCDKCNSTVLQQYINSHKDYIIYNLDPSNKIKRLYCNGARLGYGSDIVAIAIFRISNTIEVYINIDNALIPVRNNFDVTFYSSNSFDKNFQDKSEKTDIISKCYIKRNKHYTYYVVGVNDVITYHLDIINNVFEIRYQDITVLSYIADYEFCRDFIALVFEKDVNTEQKVKMIVDLYCSTLI